MRGEKKQALLCDLQSRKAKRSVKQTGRIPISPRWGTPATSATRLRPERRCRHRTRRPVATMGTSARWTTASTAPARTSLPPGRPATTAPPALPTTCARQGTAQAQRMGATTDWSAPVTSATATAPAPTRCWRAPVSWAGSACPPATRTVPAAWPLRRRAPQLPGRRVQQGSLRRVQRRLCARGKRGRDFVR